MPEVSVIIPVYNVEKYLEQCLDSVINQTLKDIEIICINDCSTDNSLEIMQAYATKDSRIKIIDFKKNKGVATARNEGIKLAKGTYIGFVDSDDWVDLDFYEKMHNAAHTNNSDLVKGSIKLYKINSISDFPEGAEYKTKTKFMYAQYFWSGLYKHDFIQKNNLYFDNLIYSQDRLFVFKAVHLANNFNKIDTTFYHYRKREDSATTGDFTDKKWLCYSKAILDILNYLNQIPINQDEYADIINKLIVETTYYTFKFDNKLHYKVFDFIEILLKDIKPNTYIDSDLLNTINLRDATLLKKYQNKLIFENLRKRMQYAN